MPISKQEWLTWPSSCFSSVPPIRETQTVVFLSAFCRKLIVFSYSSALPHPLYVTLWQSMGIFRSTCFHEEVWYIVSLLFPSTSESHDVPCLSVGLPCILPFDSVTELFLSDFSIADFSGEACTFTFSVAKLVQGRILQVPGALFPEFFQKLFSGCASQ